MAYEQKPGQGSLFKNDRKEADNHPDYKGSINIDGREYWLSAWIKEGAKGKFMSLSAKPKEAAKDQRKSAPKAPAPDFKDDDLSEVPF